MSEIVLTPRSGLERLTVPGRRGAATAQPGITLALRKDLALASVMARKGKEAALVGRVREAFGLALPTDRRREGSDALAFAWAGPGQWLAMQTGNAGHDLEARLRRECGGLASISDQSDGRQVIRIGGRDARAALAKGVMLDLHPRAFRAGDTAITSIAYIGVQLWQLDEVPTYEFAAFRSFAGALWHFLAEAGAEFGVAVEGEV